MTDNKSTSPSFLTRREFCEALRISETSYHSLAKRGLVRPVRIGRSVLIPVSEVAAVIERLNGQPSGADTNPASPEPNTQVS